MYINSKETNKESPFKKQLKSNKEFCADLMELRAFAFDFNFIA